MLNASGMQLIFLPKSPETNRRVWKLLKVVLCVQGGGRDEQLSPPKLETTSHGEGKVQNHRAHGGAAAWEAPNATPQLEQGSHSSFPLRPGDRANY